ncbi:isocitrate/isopropylmalate dehydrogenase [Xenococcus sp. PCC 7305]|uniref:isocitrate/isopropylmalate dehydrogenase family protein n=1 Tax=Xenococcus sp. PCC 7305 TaxID=102125 RepID=UPI0002ACD74D|nr:3-isopropylmalate dehydrogenase [Xenococcus sp. PCC 7305]ELS00844.1 isocitrate/isopropylmalate dehydrogenase [Xenococcus sp. PCC 7305]
MNNQYRIAALPGEGIGLEVVEATLVILQKLAQKHDFQLQIDYGVIGKSAFQKYGSYFPETTAQLCEQSDGILFGAVSKGGLLELRKRFDFFVNLRPVKTFPSLIDKSSLKRDYLSGVDILFVRELVSGIYFGAAGRGEDTQGNYGYHTMQYYDWQIKRIAKVAFAKAQKRRGLLTVAHKENALPYLPWTDLVAEVAQEYPDVTVEPMLVDNLAMQLVINPQHFDVILAGNLFGDILSDLGGALAGSVGLLGSASLNEAGFGLYEPIHGTAPDIAGKNQANPLGTLASAMMMLEQWGERDAIANLQAAWNKILTQGYRTRDLYSQEPEILVTTQELVELFLEEIEN